MACRPTSTRLSMTMPPPTPVPRITPKTTAPSRPAPSIASESAKQLASFAMRTSRPSARERSRSSGRPLRHTVLELRSTPPAAESAPGVPTPTVPRAESASSACLHQCRDAGDDRLVGVRRGGDALAVALDAGAVERDQLDLGPAEIDPIRNGALAFMGTRSLRVPLTPHRLRSSRRRVGARPGSCTGTCRSPGTWSSAARSRRDT